MSLKYIRNYYKVPAFRGTKIIYSSSDGEAIPAKITGSCGARLRARIKNHDGAYQRYSHIFHPTWHIIYIPNPQVDTDPRNQLNAK